MATEVMRTSRAMVSLRNGSLRFKHVRGKGAGGKTEEKHKTLVIELMELWTSSFFVALSGDPSVEMAK